MLITPSGVPNNLLRAQDIAAMALSGSDGACDPLPPSSEWRFHRDIQRARKDVNAIVHTHSPYATTLASLRRDIPAVHYMIAAFGGSVVRCTDYAPYGTAELSKLAVAGLGEGHGVLLGNHGAIVTAGDLGKALWRAVELEQLARLYYLALLAGAPVIFRTTRSCALWSGSGITGRRRADWGCRPSPDPAAPRHLLPRTKERVIPDHST